MARRGHAYPNVRVVAGDLVNTSLGSLPPRASVEEGLARAGRLDVAGFAVSSRDARASACATTCAARSRWDSATCRPRRVAPTAPRRRRRRRRDRGAPRAGRGRAARARPRRDDARGGGGADRRGVCAYDGRRRWPRAWPRSSTTRLIGCSRRVAAARRRAGESGLRGGRRGAGRRGRRGPVRAAGSRRRGRGRWRGRGPPARRRDGRADRRACPVSDRLRALRPEDAGWTSRRRAPSTTRRRVRCRGSGPRGSSEDLRRRDFTVNAMAAELSSGSFHLVDPFGGRRDLAARRLRVLHPLSFVEDPTRLFRAARYAVRLGLTLDRVDGGVPEAGPRAGAFRRALGGAAGRRAEAGAERTARRARARRHSARPASSACSIGVIATRPTTAARIGALASGERLGPAPWAVGGPAGASSAGPSRRPGAAGRRRCPLPAGGERRARRAPRAPSSRGRARGWLTSAPRRPRSAAARDLRGRPGLELAWLWLNGDAAVRRALTRFVARDAAVRPWLDGDEVMALGIPRGPAVARVLDELRDGRLDRTLRDRAAAAAHVRRRAGPHGPRWASGRSDPKEG